MQELVPLQNGPLAAARSAAMPSSSRGDSDETQTVTSSSSAMPTAVLAPPSGSPESSACTASRAASEMDVADRAVSLKFKPEASIVNSRVNCGKGGVGGGGGGGVGDGGGGDSKGLQSLQSVLVAQELYSDPGPPSSQSPSKAWMQLSWHVWGGDSGGPGGRLTRSPQS